MSSTTSPTERRRTQNRIAQRNHRKMVKSGNKTARARSANELVWTQPRTISSQSQMARTSNAQRQTQPLPSPSSIATGASQRQERQQRQGQQQQQQLQGSYNETGVAGMDAYMLSPPSQIDTCFAHIDLDLPADPLVPGQQENGADADAGDLFFGMMDTIAVEETTTDRLGQSPHLHHSQNGEEEEEEDDDDDGGYYDDSDATRDFSGYNALHLAAVHGHTSMVRLLLLHNKEHQQRQPRQQQQQHHHRQHVHGAAVADMVNTPTSDGQTALHLAARGDHADAARELLDQGADPLRQDADGQTPLHVAAAEGSLAVATLLLLDRRLAAADNGNSGGGLALRDNGRQTPLHRAVVGGHEPLVRLLLGKGARSNTLVG